MTVDDLNKIKNEYKNSISLRTDEKEVRIVVGMGNSGLVAGSRDILHELVRLVDENNLSGRVNIMQEARASIKGNNPVVRIYEKNTEIAVYANVTKQAAEKIVKEHIINGNTVEEYLYKGENKE